MKIHFEGAHACHGHARRQQLMRHRICCFHPGLGCAAAPSVPVCSATSCQHLQYASQVLKIESILKSPGYGRDDMAKLLQSVQLEEKQKLQMTAQIQVLKKAGHPSERVVTHDQCGFENRPLQHHCIHVHEISVADGLKDAEAEFEYDAALNAAIRSLQNAVTVINEYMEEVRYEVEELEAAERS